MGGSVSESFAYLSAGELIEGFRARQFSPVEVARATLERIERLNPTLNAYTVTTPERAVEQAGEAERAYAGGTAGPLAGVPMSIKDPHPDARYSHRTRFAGRSRLGAGA